MKRSGEHAVHEVFYSPGGRIEGFTIEPVYPRAESLAALKSEFKRYSLALSKPVLDFEAREEKAERQRAARAARRAKPESS